MSEITFKMNLLLFHFSSNNFFYLSKKSYRYYLNRISMLLFKKICRLNEFHTQKLSSSLFNNVDNQNYNYQTI